jgi:mannose-6-phosphate isomerase
VTEFPGGELYPLLLNPRAIEKVWGGRELARIFDFHLPANTSIGEVWTAWDGLTVINGPAIGTTLAELVRDQPSALLGSPIGEADPDTFPLLAKFLHARENLSIQVHPDDDGARRLEQQLFGKSEMWFVVAAEPGAIVWHGPKRELSSAELRDALQTGRIPELLQQVQVSSGDVLINPPGTIHALGRDIVIFELQQSSDLTYRLFDWERATGAGPPRALHLEQGLAVADLVPAARHKIETVTFDEDGWRRQILGACRYYAAELWELTGRPVILPAIGRFQILTTLTGQLVITSRDSARPRMTLPSGHSVVVPADTADVTLAAATASCQVFRSYVPSLAADVVAPLRSRGIADAAILQLGGNPNRSDLRFVLDQRGISR